MSEERKINGPDEEPEIVKVETKIIAEENDDEDVGLIIDFAKPYYFEGEAYKQIDLTGLENLTAQDLIWVHNHTQNKASIELVPEVTVEYACLLAHRATGKPIEFFKGLPIKEATKLKNRIMGFSFA